MAEVGCATAAARPASWLPLLASRWRAVGAVGELPLLASCWRAIGAAVCYALWVMAVMASVMVAIADELLALLAPHSDLQWPGTVYRHVIVSIAH